MGGGEDGLSSLREELSASLAKLPSEQREQILIGFWMSHDARWFAAAARTLGMDTANLLNREAVHAEGKAEARRLARLLGIGPVRSTDEYLALQDVLAGFLAPGLLDYQVVKANADLFEILIGRCFANENVVRAGMAEEYECGIVERILGWLDGLGVQHEIRPALGRCLKVRGQECRYQVQLRFT